MSHDDPQDKLPALPQQLQDVPRQLVRRSRQRLSNRLDSLQRQIKDQAGERADQLARKIAEPENLARLQSFLAHTAQLALKQGFKRDPHAESLYQFVQWLEARHDRQVVSAAILRRNLLLDGSLLGLLRAVAPELIDPILLPIAPPEIFEQPLDDPRAALRQAQRQLLILLCELAELEHDQPCPPSSAPDQALIDYFEESPVPTRFYDLARLASGDPEAFADRPKRRSRLPRALIQGQSNALSRAFDLASDPAVGFIVQSYLFFFQAYTTQMMIESLPETIQNLIALERAQHDIELPVDHDHEDAIIVDDP